VPKRKNDNEIQVSFIVKKSEHAVISEKAKKYGMTLAGYVKFCALNANIEAKIAENLN
jgi:hypothetical protein